MRKNQLPFVLILMLGAFLFLVGCEIPSPNAEAPVPVNPNAVPAQNSVPTEDPAAGEMDDQGEGTTAEGEGGDAASGDALTDSTDAANTNDGEANNATAGEAGGATDANAGGGENTDAAGGEQPAAGADQAGEAAAPANDQQNPTEAPREPWNYAVQPGDTFGSIAERNGLTLDELQAANNLVNIHALDVGQVLVIPVPGVPVEAAPATDQTQTEQAAPTGETVHVVTYGDTLFNIGQRYGFSVEELQVYNGILDATRIDIGQEIRIPSQ